MTKIVIQKKDGKFILKTGSGLPIGERLISSSPAAGKKYPSMVDAYDTEMSALKAALEWNIYLGARKCRKK
jgi:hypothetical protein